MLKIDALPPEFIKGKEVGNHRIKLVVANVVMKKVGDGEQKPVMYFSGKERGMVINSGNWDAMEMVYGENSDFWIGKPVELFAVQTQTPSGEPTLGCRITPIAGPETAATYAPLSKVQPPAMGPGEQAAAEVKAGLQPMPTAGSDMSDDILFAPLRELP